MRCPRCDKPLVDEVIDAAGVEVRAMKCLKCTGHWLESDDLKSVEQVVDVKLIEWRHLPGIETQGRALFCVRCAPPMVMDKVVSTRDHKVVMDVCSKCRGVWLDYGELEAIMQKGLLAALVDLFSFVRRVG